MSRPDGEIGLPWQQSPEWDSEWQMWLQRVGDYTPRPRPHDLSRARYFALVSAFGDMEKYHTDPEFHARVHLAEQLLYAIDKAAGFGRKEHPNADAG